MSCSPKKLDKTKLCIGDLKHKITIQTRRLGFDANADGPSYVFQTIATVWAAIETSNAGNEVFSQVEIGNSATHLFWIRYSPLFNFLETGEHYISYNNRKYRVLSYFIAEEENEWICIRAQHRGDEAKEAVEI